MRDYGKIYTNIWNSRKFQSLTSDDARLAYLYLHTCPSVNSIGCFVLRDGYAATDLGWPIERYHRALEALSIALLVGFDRAESLVRIVDFLKHDPFTNKNHAAGAVKLARALPESVEKDKLFHDIAQMKFLGGIELNHSPPIGLSIGLSDGYRTPEPEPEPKKKEREVAVAAAALDRVVILEAMGVGPDGVTGPASFIGTQGDMAEAAKWAGLGLSEAQQIGVILETCQRQRAKQAGWVPKRFSYFTPSMADLAATMAGPVPTGTASSSQADREAQAKRARWKKIAGGQS